MSLELWNAVGQLAFVPVEDIFFTSISMVHNVRIHLQSAPAPLQPLKYLFENIQLISARPNAVIAYPNPEVTENEWLNSKAGLAHKVYAE